MKFKKTIITLFIFLPLLSAAQELTEAQKAAMNAANAISNASSGEKAPKPVYWTNSIAFDLGLSQTWMSDWAAGGYPSVSLATGIDGKAAYERKRVSWNNRMQLNYGFLWSADKINLIQSSNDRIYLESKFDYKMTDKSKWRYSAGLDFRTQFADTKNNYRQEDPADPKSKWIGDLKSTFFSPAYLNLALGVDWKPNNWFDMSIAPITGGVVIVSKNDLRQNYGMLPVEGQEGKYHSAKWQLGTQIKANAKINVNGWFNYDTQLVLFGNYLGKTIEHKAEDGSVLGKTNDFYRINWDNRITFNVAKYFKVALQTWLIYDPSIIYVNKSTSETKYGPCQFKEFFSINFTYSIASKKK